MFAKYVCLYVALPLQPLCSSSDSTKFQARSFDDENANLTAAKIAAIHSVLRRHGASPRSNPPNSRMPWRSARQCVTQVGSCFPAE